MNHIFNELEEEWGLKQDDWTLDQWREAAYLCSELAHAVKDANGRAYNRTKYIKQRHEMMQHWSDYLDGLQVDNVVGVQYE